VLRSAIRILAIASVIPIPLLAQGQVDPTPAIEAVTQAAFLEGNWAGEGWIQMGPGPKEEFTQTETVTSMLDGAVMLIEGVGHSKGEDAAKQIHHALAVISFDPVNETLVFSSYVAGRPRLDLVPEVAPNTFKWGFSPPNGGEIRYSIVIEDGVWHEVGEFSRDGESWHQFFEMRLTKLGASGRSEPASDRASSHAEAQLERGAAVYRERCYACHEVESGDGEELSPDDFRGGPFPGARGERRALRVPMGGPSVEPEEADGAPALLLSFSLPPGAYATSVLAEVMKG